jgi:hypothetical protein
MKYTIKYVSYLNGNDGSEQDMVTTDARPTYIRDFLLSAISFIVVHNKGLYLDRYAKDDEFCARFEKSGKVAFLIYAVDENGVLLTVKR